VRGEFFTGEPNTTDEIRIKNKIRATDARAIECSFVLVFIYLLPYLSVITNSVQNLVSLQQ
jgi:hypothetical protein